MAAEIHVRVLGAVSLSVDGRDVPVAGARQRRLLCRLLLADGAVVPASRLRAEVWEGSGGTAGTLKTSISRLRASLGPASGELRLDGDGYALSRARLVTDAGHFEELVASARRAAGLEAAAAAYAAALAVWRGDPYEGVADAAFLEGEIERLRGLREIVREESFEAQLEAGGGAELVPPLTAAAAAHPGRERLAMALAVALYRTGHQLESLDALRRTERYLRSEFGVSPSGRFRALETRLLVQDPSLLSRGEAPGASSSTPSAVTAPSLAADAFAASGAPTEAVRMARRAVVAARALGDPVPLAQALARLARMLGIAECGDQVGPVLHEAAALARRSHDGAALAQVALARFGAGVVGEDPDQLLADLMEPLALLDPRAPECVDLLCAAMHQVLYTADSPGADALLRRAETLAGTAGGIRAGAVARVARAVLLPHRVDQAGELPEAVAAALEAAAVSGDPGLRILALHARVRLLMEHGRVTALAAALADFERAAYESQYPFAWLRVRLLADAVQLLLGHVDGLDARILDTLAVGRRMGVASAGETTAVQLGLCWIEQHRQPELLAMTDPGTPRAVPELSGAVRQYALALSGATDAAADGTRAMVSSRAWADAMAWSRPLVVAFLAEAAWHLGLAEVAPELAGALAEHGGRFLVIGHGTGSYGPVDRVLGLMLALGGDTAAGLDALGRARAQAEAGGAALWADRCALAAASVLLRRGGAGGREQALELVREVRASAAPRSPRLAGELDAIARAAASGA